MSDSGWADNTREHTFSTGRVAKIRKFVNVFDIGTETGLGIDMVAGSHDPDLSMGEVVLGLLRYIWVDPVVLGPGEKAPKDAVSISFADIDTVEVMETLEIWKEAADKAARFREQPPGVGGRKGRAGVGGGAKPPPRSRARKPAGPPR